MDMSSRDEERKPKAKWLATIVATGTTLGLIGLMAPFVFSRSSLPYMATPKDKVAKALRYALSTSSQLKNSQGRVFIDLGSGDGEAVFQAVQAGYDKAIGVELNSTLYVLAQMRRMLFWSSYQRKYSSFRYTNMFSYDVGQADTVMIFGVKPLMVPISQKLAKECAPGTRILSYRFLLPVQNDTSVKEGLLNADLVYDKDEMRVYCVR
jgi:hypothetical protein